MKKTKTGSALRFLYKLLKQRIMRNPSSLSIRVEIIDKSVVILEFETAVDKAPS